jgi:hypothetical protein
MSSGRGWAIALRLKETDASHCLCPALFNPGVDAWKKHSNVEVNFPDEIFYDR